MDVSTVAAAAEASPSAAAQPAQSGIQPTPQAGDPAAVQEDHRNSTLIADVAKLFGQSEAPHQSGLNVSYRVVHDPNEIVTVFTDPVTGKEVAQFPPEMVIQIAEFFDKQSGVAVDSSV